MSVLNLENAKWLIATLAIPAALGLVAHRGGSVGAVFSGNQVPSKNTRDGAAVGPAQNSP